MAVGTFSMKNAGGQVLAFISEVVSGQHKPTHTLDPKAYGGCDQHLNINVRKSSTEIKQTAGQIYSITLSNRNASAESIYKLYDKAGGTANWIDHTTDVPVKVIPIPAKTTIHLDFGDVGIYFANGIHERACTGIAHTDDTDVSANDVVVNLNYK